MKRTVFHIVVIVITGLGLETPASGEVDSLKARDTLLMKHSEASSMQPIENKSWSDRLWILAIGVVSVGGIALLLDKKRRKADKQWQERQQA
jgi:hypothetical protein